MAFVLGTYSLTSPTLASTDFCACSPWDRVSLVVGNNSWCQAAALPVGTSIRLVNSDVTKTRRSLSRCKALAAATFNCSDVNGGISTGGGGGATITPVVADCWLTTQRKICLLILPANFANRVQNWIWHLDTTTIGRNGLGISDEGDA